MQLLSCGFSPAKALAPSDWQLTILLTAAVLDAPYEWDVNEPVAKLLGFSDRKLELIRQVDLSSHEEFSDRQRLVGKLVMEMAKSDRASAKTVEAVKAAFGVEATMELFMVHGTYSMLARTMNSCRIDYDERIPGLSTMLKKTFTKDLERQRELDMNDRSSTTNGTVH